MRRLLVLGWLAGIGLAPPARAEDSPRGLDLYFIDVMGGAATLVVTPERETILIDSGWPGNDDRDPKRIVRVLKQAGCDRIDHLVTTHWHMDHFGGVAGLSKLVEIGHFWDRGLPEDRDPALDFPDGPRDRDPLAVAYRAASKGKRTALKPGDKLPLRGDVHAAVLAAGGKLIDAPSAAPANPLCAEAPAAQPVDNSDNARSVVLRFRYGKFDFLDCGDLTWNAEQALVCPVDRIGAIDLYQVTHHGMDISNNPALLKTIAPTVAIMNNGPRKGGSAATVERLRAVPSIRAAYQLHRNAGTKAEENTQPDLIANRDREGGEFIRVSVPPGGGRFTVRIGAAGAPREFESR
ncbi:ComEC family competence protein [Aquisphaera giovannonii]|uniref:ComEC family competence protein n=1 Tax=Aquisphaera giovannonii TaxID=406548 RepID=A0A5B9W327_9BACT|nr:MBL fold metallo-hydrolase [Aquisphaera giovannonii]QEH34360.1 ComEC family competence protein [Aquisphaera giovannonii]